MERLKDCNNREKKRLTSIKTKQNGESGKINGRQKKYIFEKNTIPALCVMLRVTLDSSN